MSYNFKILSEWLSVHSPSKHVELKTAKSETAQMNQTTK